MSMHPSALQLGGGADSRDDIGLNELRTETLTLLVVAIFVLACVAAIGLLATASSAPTDVPWNPTPYLEGLLGLMLTAAATYWALRFGPTAATAVLVLGLSATLAGALFLNPGSSLATYFVLIVLVATGVLDWRAGIATALLATSVIVGSVVFAAGVIPPDVAEQ